MDIYTYKEILNLKALFRFLSQNINKGVFGTPFLSEKCDVITLRQKESVVLTHQYM